MLKRTMGEKVFAVFNTIFLVALSLACLYPLWHVAMASISDPVRIYANRGPLLLPLGGFSLEHLKGYRLVFENPNIISGFMNTIIYLVGGTTLSLALTVMGAYVLSLKGLYWNYLITRIITFTMYFAGGLIPFYLQVNSMGLIDNRWVIVLPIAINTFNLIIMRTAFAGIPESLAESARLDGAGHIRIMWSIMIPLAQATIAVIVLYYSVSMWNMWFNAAIFLKTKSKFPLSLILREILILNDTSNMVQLGSVGQSQTEQYRLLIKYCTIMVATVPILLVYPFLQKYFVKGIMIGSVKG